MTKHETPYSRPTSCKSFGCNGKGNTKSDRKNHKTQNNCPKNKNDEIGIINEEHWNNLSKELIDLEKNIKTGLRGEVDSLHILVLNKDSELKEKNDTIQRMVFIYFLDFLQFEYLSYFLILE
jgi:hypothetical protein